jgi:hypothetical protein
MFEQCADESLAGPIQDLQTGDAGITSDCGFTGPFTARSLASSTRCGK